jgi:GT2 family glycosyltransferase/glycosyltransferase involved in cell wall biosynthesis
VSVVHGTRHEASVTRELLLQPLRFAFSLIDQARAGLDQRRTLEGATTVPTKEVGRSLEGISVVVPERANVALLGECLRSALAACRGLAEPSEILVVVNGSPATDYEPLRAELPAVRWLFFRDDLGHSGAIRAGARAARYDWMYLLRSDLVLDPHALEEVARWRAPRVFAVASQIFFADPARPRETTGWVDLRIENGLLEIFERAPGDDRTVRGNLCASSGSSLFQKRLLQTIMGPFDPYSLFDWADVEWSTRAQRLGYDVLFCPASEAWRRSGAMVGRLHEASKVDRVAVRDRTLFQLRNINRLVSHDALFQQMLAIDRRSFRELMRPRQFLGILRARFELEKSGIDDSLLPYATAARFVRPPGLPERSRVLVVSPYAMLPPKHGSAVRTMKLLREIAGTHDVILVSDEPASYETLRAPDLQAVSALHPVGGRVEIETEAGVRIDRIRSHSHQLLRDMVHKRIACDAPAVVLVEHVELSALVTQGKKGVPWCLHLQDVLIAGDGSEADRLERKLTNLHDTVVVCSEEDAALVDHPAALVLPACADFDPAAYRPSPAEPRLLFLGPFRYPPNLIGIRTFLEQVWPRLLEEVPDAQLDILGGDEGPAIAAGERCFGQPGVRLRPFVAQPRDALDACALTINPIRGNRGSAVKVIESLAAGRVCVSTVEGARGFRSAGFRSLVEVPSVAEMLVPLLGLLSDTSGRRMLESADGNVLAGFSWAAAAARLAQHWSRARAEGEPSRANRQRALEPRPQISRSA